jgi:hypothetical protein
MCQAAIARLCLTSVKPASKTPRVAVRLRSGSPSRKKSPPPDPRVSRPLVSLPCFPGRGVVALPHRVPLPSKATGPSGPCFVYRLLQGSRRLLWGSTAPVARGTPALPDAATSAALCMKSAEMNDVALGRGGPCPCRAPVPSADPRRPHQPPPPTREGGAAGPLTQGSTVQYGLPLDKYRARGHRAGRWYLTGRWAAMRGGEEGDSKSCRPQGALRGAK